MIINDEVEVIVVTPVYEDQEVCQFLFKEILNVLGNKAFIVAVDDGSIQKPLETSR